MKKSLLITALLATLGGAAHAQVSLYGLLDVSFGKSIADDAANKRNDFHFGGDGDAQFANSAQGNSTSRIGIKGSTDVGGGVKANFKLETAGINSSGEVGKGASGDPNDPFFNRQAWVGLSGSFGEFRLGRQDSVAFQTMIGYDFNGASNGVSALGYAAVAPWAPGRQSRALQYIAPAIGGLTLQAGLQFKGNEPPAGGDPVRDTFSGGLTYTLGALSVSATMETKRTNAGDRFMSVAGSYDFGVVKVMLASADGGPNLKGVSLGAVAPVAGASVGFLYGKNTGTAKGGAWEVFANKEVLKNTYAYFEIGQANAKTGFDGQGMAIGLIYTF